MKLLGSFRLKFWLLAAALAATTCSALGQGVVINEFMAQNGATRANEAGEYADWIELHNPTSRVIDVGGLYLTDDLGNPTQWQAPTGQPAATTIAPGGYLLIWADQAVTGAQLHANFKLDPSGEEIALFDKDGTTLLDSVTFERQRTDISFGRDPADASRWTFLATPTPGSRNVGALSGEVADLVFSHVRGFYDQAFSLTISTATPGATIVYTVDGSTPCDPLGNLSAAAQVYKAPIAVATTTCIRAAAYEFGWLATPVQTHTYIFPEGVRHQATDPATGAQVVPPGCPTTWPAGKQTGAVTGDYQVDPDVVGDNGKDKFSGLYARTFVDDLKAGPTISLVMARDDWFGPTGIYINQNQDGTERACSLEWVDPSGQEGFQIDCAIGMQGGVSGGGTSLSRWKTFKLSMRPRFKTTLDNGKPTGGPSELDYRVFPDSPVSHYDTFVIDSLLANNWSHPSSYTTPNYLADQFTSDLHNALGGYSAHGCFAHVYINGLYWGMYNVHDRPDNAWAAQMFGGEKEEYDCLKHNANSVVNNGQGGNASADFNAMLGAADAVAADPTNAAKYDALCRQLDVDNFIANVLTRWFVMTVSSDWPDKNWYATRRVPDGPWRFHIWDAEHALEHWSSGNALGLSEPRTGSGLHDKLKGNAEYRMRFADLAHRFFFNGGALSYPAVADRYRTRIAEIDRMIVGESARWGDTRRTPPGTRADWVVVEDGILSKFFQPRPDFVLNYLKTNGLYPGVGAPVFNVNGTYLHGGYVASGDVLSMTLPAGTNGTVYYTLDGSDPREPAVAPANQQPASAIALMAESAPKKVLVPAADIGTAWRGASEPFDDSAWTHGTPVTSVAVGGVGYDTDTTYQPYITYDVLSLMYARTGSCYIRIPFTVPAPLLAVIKSLTLRARCDDGFVAFLNGVEVGFVNRPATLAWNSTCASRSDSTDFVEMLLSNAASALKAGTNILAVQAMNNSTTSSDFLFSADLIGSTGTGASAGGNVSPTALLYTGPIPLRASAQVRARTLSNGTWSALNEAVYAVGPVAESLRISEIMYHPQDSGNPDDPNTEFIELTNVGSQTIDLNLVRFTHGVDFTFPDVALEPGGYTLVVKDAAAFSAKYGSGLPVVGIYTGSLDNGGERIRLEDALGASILDFEYKDGWYRSTDGRGYSLVALDPATAEPDSYSDKTAWRASHDEGGSPGEID
jgi:hypothetical protein